MPQALNLRNGTITYDNFFWLLEHADSNPADLLLGEDLLQISFCGGQYLLDAGWYGAATPHGQFAVMLVENQDWEHPLRKEYTREISRLPALLQECIDWLWHTRIAPAEADPRPLLQVVAGIVYNDRGEVLLSSRPAGKAYAGYWEFAGGKVEAGEGELCDCVFSAYRPTAGAANCRRAKASNGAGSSRGVMMCRPCCRPMPRCWRRWLCPRSFQVA